MFREEREELSGSKNFSQESGKDRVACEKESTMENPLFLPACSFPLPSLFLIPLSGCICFCPLAA